MDIVYAELDDASRVSGLEAATAIPGGTFKPGGAGESPGGVGGTATGAGAICAIGEDSIGETSTASCEPDPMSESTAIDDVGDLGGMGGGNESRRILLGLFVAAGVVGRCGREAGTAGVDGRDDDACDGVFVDNVFRS